LTTPRVAHRWSPGCSVLSQLAPQPLSSFPPFFLPSPSLKTRPLTGLGYFNTIWHGRRPPAPYVHLSGSVRVFLLFNSFPPTHGQRCRSFPVSLSPELARWPPFMGLSAQVCNSFLQRFFFFFPPVGYSRSPIFSLLSPFGPLLAVPLRSNQRKSHHPSPLRLFFQSFWEKRLVFFKHSPFPRGFRDLPHPPLLFFPTGLVQLSEIVVLCLHPLRRGHPWPSVANPPSPSF